LCTKQHNEPKEHDEHKIQKLIDSDERAKTRRKEKHAEHVLEGPIEIEQREFKRRECKQRITQQKSLDAQTPTAFTWRKTR
jgi:hypothetical protein